MIRDLLMAAAGTGDAPKQVVFMYSTQNQPTHPNKVTIGTGGITNWVVPEGVTSICAIAVGSGGVLKSYTPSSNANSGCGGGGVSFTNNIPVTPGETLIIDGRHVSYNGGVNAIRLMRGSTVLLSANHCAMAGKTDGTVSRSGASTTGAVGTVRSSGGDGGMRSSTAGAPGGGGGVGGYVNYASGGNGGDGSDTTTTNYGTNPSSNSGGSAGGAGATYASSSLRRGGGGIDLLGIGTTGEKYNTPGSGGMAGNSSYGGGFGGGAPGQSGASYTSAPNGAIRIIWGEGRSFPNNAGDA